MKPLVLYHANCADGFGAAFAAWMEFGDDAEYLPLKYGQIIHMDDLPPLKGRAVYMLDFSLPKPLMETVILLADMFIWLDHHKTAFEMWCGAIPVGGVFTETTTRYHARLDNNKSGALLAWEFFQTSAAPLMFKHIDDYDRWQFKIDGTKEFNKAMWSRTPWSFGQWELWLNGANNEFYMQGAAILRAHDQNVQAVVKGAAMPIMIDIQTEVDGGRIHEYKRGLAANCPPHLTSDAGHELANQSGTFGLCWALSKTGIITCSLRSNGNYDVSAIAKAFPPGGGHMNAAGFETTVETLMKWLRPPHISTLATPR